MVFIECMACGTPVIGANSGGPRDFVDETVGTLIPDDDLAVPANGKVIDDVEAAICKALDEDWKKIKGPACLKLTEKFSMNEQCRGIVKKVEDMLNPKGVMIFQLGTNNWQTIEEPAPGSGILHEAHQSLTT